MHRLSTASSSAVRRSAAKAAKPVLKRGAHKEIKFSNEGRASILNGVDILANAVSVTLGPKGECPLLTETRVSGATDTSISRSQRHHRATLWWAQDYQGWVPNFALLQSVLAAISLYDGRLARPGSWRQ